MLTTNEFLDKFDKELLTFEECKKNITFFRFSKYRKFNIYGCRKFLWLPNF